MKNFMFGYELHSMKQKHNETNITKQSKMLYYDCV